ncbi:hypothetical protein B0H65DRAFT_99984 [Neurospora tetraspora]|uniref:Secreted protein n=1 Tax=Neurospora tetraspora TaxID=94610 RepID=A0AAE0MTS0_9PEZI|nr:hypothetical protein B0H65DRAFT_99984 [Neurospora tetraspora]
MAAPLIQFLLLTIIICIADSIASAIATTTATTTASIQGSSSGELGGGGLDGGGLDGGGLGWFWMDLGGRRAKLGEGAGLANRRPDFNIIGSQSSQSGVGIGSWRLSSRQRFCLSLSIVNFRANA